MRALHGLVAVLILLSFVPAADSAENPALAPTVALTNTPNTGALDGTLRLADTSVEAASVQVVPSTPRIFVYPIALAAGAPVSGATFEFEFTFSEPAGDVTVEWGYFKDGIFTSVASATAPITTLGLQGTASGSDVAGPGAAFPAGSYRALNVTTTTEKGLLVGPSVSGATTLSSATIPLPELSALAMVAVGIVAVGGLYYRRVRQEG